MKKISFFAVALAAVAFTGCNGVGNVTLENSGDSIAYEFGVANSHSLKMIAMQKGVDTTYINEFLAGMQEGALEDKVDPAKDAYAKGVEFGRDVKRTTDGLCEYLYEGDSTKFISAAIVVKGMMDGYADADSVAEAAQKNFQAKMDAVQQEKTMKQYGANKEAGEKFLAENAKKEGVTTTASGLQYKVLKEGKGALPTAESVLKVKYEGRLIDGKVFDSNTDSDKPFEVKMKNPSVIQGWVEVLKLMPAGSKWEVYIPYALAYGERGTRGIEPFSTLIFTIEILK